MTIRGVALGPREELVAPRRVVPRVAHGDEVERVPVGVRVVPARPASASIPSAASAGGDEPVVGVQVGQLRAGRERDPRRAHAWRPGHMRRSAQARHAGRARVARAPAVAQQVHVQLELGALGRQPQHLVVQLVERRARPQQPEPRADAAHVRVDRHVAQAVREQQHAGRGLAADARERAERARATPATGAVAHPRQVQVLAAAPRGSP